MGFCGLGLERREGGGRDDGFGGGRDGECGGGGGVGVGDVELVHLLYVSGRRRGGGEGVGTRYSHNRAFGGRILTMRNSRGVE